MNKTKWLLTHIFILLIELVCAVAIGLMLSTLLDAFATPVHAQGPVPYDPWHGYKHAAQGTTWQTALEQTTSLVAGQGQTYAGANGNWLHFQAAPEARTGSLMVYDAWGNPITQFPKGVNNFSNNVADGRAAAADMPPGAQVNAYATCAAGATSGTTFCPFFTINPNWYFERQLTSPEEYVQ